MYNYDFDATAQRIQFLVARSKYVEADELLRELLESYSSKNKKVKICINSYRRAMDKNDSTHGIVNKVKQLMNQSKYSEAETYIRCLAHCPKQIDQLLKALYSEGDKIRALVTNEKWDTDFLSARYDDIVLNFMIKMMYLIPLVASSPAEIKKKLLCRICMTTSLLSKSLKDNFDGVGIYDGRNIFTYLNYIYYFSIDHNNLFYNHEQSLTNAQVDACLEIIYRDLKAKFCTLFSKCADPFDQMQLKPQIYVMRKIDKLRLRKNILVKLIEERQEINKSLEDASKVQNNINGHIKACDGDLELNLQQLNENENNNENLQILKDEICNLRNQKVEFERQVKKGKEEIEGLHVKLAESNNGCVQPQEELDNIVRSLNELQKTIQSLQIKQIDVKLVLYKLDDYAVEKIIKLENTFSENQPESILYALSVIGEIFTLKILTPKTKYLLEINYETFIKIRNGLIHIEWYLVKDHSDKLLNVNIEKCTEAMAEITKILEKAKAVYKNNTWMNRGLEYYSDAFDENLQNNPQLRLDELEEFSACLLTESALKEQERLEPQIKQMCVCDYAFKILQRVDELVSTLSHANILDSYIFENYVAQAQLYDKTLDQLRIGLPDQIVTKLEIKDGVANITKKDFENAVIAIKKYHKGTCKVMLPKSLLPDEVRVDHSSAQKVNYTPNAKSLIEEIIRYGKLCHYYSELEDNQPLLHAVLFHKSRIFNLIEQMNPKDLDIIKTYLGGGQIYQELKMMRNHYAHGHDFFVSSIPDVEWVAAYSKKLKKLQSGMSIFRDICASLDELDKHKFITRKADDATDKKNNTPLFVNPHQSLVEQARSVITHFKYDSKVKCKIAKFQKLLDKLQMSDSHAKEQQQNLDPYAECVIPLPVIIQLDITDPLPTSLQIGTEPVLAHLKSDAEQRQARALKRAQDYQYALQNRQSHDTYPALVNDWVHHETVADGNCALSAIALGLLYHRNNGKDLLTTHVCFRRQFAFSFGINPDTLTSDVFSQIIDALLSPAINLDNPIIKQIIDKLRAIEHTAPGTEADQINMKIIAASNRAIKPETFEHGNIRLEYSAEAIRILARQGTLYQLAMAYVLRLYCAPHNNKHFTCNTDQLGESQDIEIILHVTNQFGEYLDDTVIAFLANTFGLTIRTKANEFGRIVRYGTGDTEILIFNSRLGQADAHFELVLPSTAEFLENRLRMPNTRVNLLVPSVSPTALSSPSFFRRLHEKFITEHRHENPQLQRAYDERFGLVLRR